MGTKMTSSSPSSPTSTLPSPARPEVMPMPPLPRPLPSRTSRRPLPPESSRDSMTDNHLLRSPSRPSRRSSMSEVWARNEHHRLLTPYFDHRSDQVIRKQPLHFESTLVLEESSQLTKLSLVESVKYLTK